MIAAPPYFLGIDIGTSGLKSALIAAGGTILGSATREYAPATPRPGWAEQDPEVWLQAALATAAEVLQTTGIDPSSVAGVGFSGQMHSAVVLDRAGAPAHPAVLWLDTRAAGEVRALWGRLGTAQIAAWTGNPIMAGVTLASLCWLKEQRPDVWARIGHVMLAKDYVRYRLTGNIHTDFSDASATGMFDAGQRRWATELLAATGVPQTWLPPIVGSTDVVGTLRPEMAAAMGLRAGTPVVCGAGDQEAQAVGNGVIRPGLLSCTIGTGGQLFMPAGSYRCDPALRLHTFCHAVPGMWHWLAATLTAGMSLRWLRDQVLAGQFGYADLADAAMAVAPGAEGLTFLPYLAGERTPHLDPLARGVFYGLTLRHGWPHMVRAVMEGVVFSLLDGLELMRELGGSAGQVVASGGGARHPLWLQLQADIFGTDIVTTTSTEASATGAALLAGVGAGRYADLPAACQEAVRWNEAVIHPQPEAVQAYRAVGERYRALYPALAARFQADQ